MGVLEDPVRRSILTSLRDGERSAGDIAEHLNRPRPGVSHHLSVLLEQEAVSCRQERTLRIYSLNVSKVLELWNDYLERAQDAKPTARSLAS